MRSRVRLILVSIALTLAQIGSALALSSSQIPTKVPTPWGSSAGASYIRTIPIPSQIGVTNCAASFTDGFPPLTFVAQPSGGCPPFGADFNGILNAITLWNRWQNAGGSIPYDSTFQTAIGGYPKGALVQSAILPGRVWYSTVENNTTNPDDQTGAAVSWTVQPGTHSPGTIIPMISASSGPPNAVLANTLTVGNASSNATNRANADTYWLFVYLWNNCTPCALFNSAGGGIARGASAAADWAANDAIQTPEGRGEGLIGADANGTTRLSGVPVVSGSTTSGGSTLGENLHSLVASEIPSITSNVSISGSGSATGTVTVYPAGNSGYYYPYYTANSWTFFNPNAASGGLYVMPALQGAISPVSTNSMSGGNTLSVSVTGSGSATSNNTGAGSHNNVERSLVVFFWISL